MKTRVFGWLNTVVIEDSDGDTFTRLEVIKGAALCLAFLVGLGVIGYLSK